MKLSYVCGVLVVMLGGVGCASPDRLNGPKVLWPVDRKVHERLGLDQNGEELPKPKDDPNKTDLLGQYFALRDSASGVEVKNGKTSTATPLVPTSPEWAANLAARTRLRNEIVAAFMDLDDYNFHSYAQSAGFLNRTGNLVGDVTVLGLTSTAAFVNGTQAKSALAAMAALVAGTRVAFDKDVLYDNTLPILLSRMQALRLIKRAEIDGALAAKNDDEYPLNRAFSDIFDYSRAGTLSAAISSLAEDANKPNGKATTLEMVLPTLKGQQFLAAKVKYTVSDVSMDGTTVTMTLDPDPKDHPAEAAAGGKDIVVQLVTKYPQLSASDQVKLLNATMKVQAKQASGGN